MTKISIAFVWALVVVCVMPILSSCSDEELQTKEERIVELSPEQQEKLDFGCISYSDVFSDEKVETQANYEYRKYVMARTSKEMELNKSLSEIYEYDYSSHVGVIKDKTCGDYRELKIFLDNEDHRNQNQHKGWLPGSISDNHNFSFTVCLVPADKFHSNGKDYAVLKIGNFLDQNFEDYPNGSSMTSILRVHLDAEDDSPETSIKLEYFDGSGKRSLSLDETNSKVGKGVFVDYRKNLDLFFVCYYAENNIVYSASRNCKYETPFPDFGFNYGVFGKLHSNINDLMGWYRSDDEDSGNENNVCLVDYKIRDDFRYNAKGQELMGYTGMYDVDIEIKKHPEYFDMYNNFLNIPVAKRFDRTFSVFRGWLEFGSNTVFYYSKIGDYE